MPSHMKFKTKNWAEGSLDSIRFIRLRLTGEFVWCDRELTVRPEALQEVARQATVGTSSPHAMAAMHMECFTPRQAGPSGRS